MPRIIIDGRQIECRDGISVLQAALDADIEVPHYCYHPGLSVVASCRLCLMEMKMPHPKTKEMDWAPKLFPSCQTPARDGMEVRFKTDKVTGNQQHVMEYYLVSHPLDCPVCDKAGECHLQDYSERFGKPTSRMVDEKDKNPKKDIGPKTLLYADRCINCSRCVRFTREVSGTSELCMVNRGNKAEIDVFPGTPLDNPLQGNVVDICPVGCLLDKDFLFAQRVWFLRSADSICRNCGTGCAIRVDQNENRVYRLKPRYNPGVNDWWMCDEGRFGWKFVNDEKRITAATVRRGADSQQQSWQSIPTIVRQRFEQVVAKHGAAALAVQLSPEMACEEAWLLASFIRDLAPEATLVLGDVQVVGEDQRFPAGCAAGEEKFTIQAEKNPNRRGIEMIIKSMGGNTATHEELISRSGEGEFKALWIVGGYPQTDWASKELITAAAKAELLVVQDMFASKLSAEAEIVLPFCAWLEREGSFMNTAGKLQPFDYAIRPPEGTMSDGQYLFGIAGHRGLYTSEHVREMMAADIPAMADLHVAAGEPVYQH